MIYTCENEHYIRPENPNPQKIIAAAVLQNGRLWCGDRHWHLMHEAYNFSGERVTQDQQGFLTDDFLFVRRRAAMFIAELGGQVSEEDAKHPYLLSEYLW